MPRQALRAAVDAGRRADKARHCHLPGAGMIARRLFTGGLVMTALFAVGHFFGFLQAARAARSDPGMADLTRAMREYKTSVLGFRPSILDFREYFSLNFSILLLLAAALGFAALAAGPDVGATIRRLAPVYVIAMLALLGTSLGFSVIQGVISCLLIAAMFALAWWYA
jgi:hypothetical protein